MTDALLPRPLAAAVLASLLAACAVGPDYVRPTMDAPAQFHRADLVLTRASETEHAFWERLGDPVLAQLIEDALRDNRELHIALARLERARALLGEAGRDYLPTVRAGGRAGEQRASAFEAPGVPRSERDGDSRGVEAVVSWELDLFGRVRRGVEAARGESDASAADLAALQVAVAGEVARNYYLLRGLQTRLAVARDNARNQERSLELVRARAEAGGGTELDSARARAQLELTLSRLPALTAEMQAAQHRLAVLTGREPGALGELLDAPAPWPELPGLLAVGTPPDLLARRPDVAAAERRLAAATARIGVATADLYPRFSLDGLIGSLAGDAGDLFDRDSERRRLVLGIDWSFLDRGRVRDRIDAAGADARAALAAWQQASLRALEETETALVRYAQSERERRHLEDAAQASARAAELARLRFEGGAAGFLDVLDAERARLEAEDLAAAARMRQAQALVGLHAALAGGWPERMPRPTPAAEPSSRVARAR
ncbi:efflux transporter outer membrane subunit [Arenimonas fontis]|uniref:TolC family protein n=1 Tax=Arenimonas fontis TaxID=2608255 RepID=A0A5B2Z819_9GAMM|nr:TolC family protein [Arenimonas fontis]KAA2284119.1 TolC family protein [Arenimonas fontis]